MIFLGTSPGTPKKPESRFRHEITSLLMISKVFRYFFVQHNKAYGILYECAIGDTGF